jgi:hypothetical protein
MDEKGEINGKRDEPQGSECLRTLFAEYHRDQGEYADGRILKDPMDHLVHGALAHHELKINLD